MTEADDDLLASTRALMCLASAVGRPWALLDLERHPLAPPCLGPRSAPMPPAMALYMSDPARDHAQVNADALNSCSARIREVCDRFHPAFAAACRAADAVEVARRSNPRLNRLRSVAVAEVIPVQQHRAERRHQLVGDVFAPG